MGYCITKSLKYLVANYPRIVLVGEPTLVLFQWDVCGGKSSTEITGVNEPTYDSWDEPPSKHGLTVDQQPAVVGPFILSSTWRIIHRKS